MSVFVFEKTVFVLEKKNLSNLPEKKYFMYCNQGFLLTKSSAVNIPPYDFHPLKYMLKFSLKYFLHQTGVIANILLL